MIVVVKTIDGEWSQLLMNDKPAGWLRRTAQEICDGKHCRTDSSLCKKPPHLVKVVPKWCGWLNGNPVRYWGNSKDDILDILRKELNNGEN